MIELKQILQEQKASEPIKLNKPLLKQRKHHTNWEQLNYIEKLLKDKYQGKKKYPIGTKYKPISEYEEGTEIPEKDLYFFKSDTYSPTDATSMMFIGQAGTFKTTQIKTHIHYQARILNTKVGILSLKEDGRDWQKCNYPSKHKGMLFPEEPATLPVIAGRPKFSLVNADEEDMRGLREFNLNPNELNDNAVLKGLGVTSAAVQVLGPILKKTKDVDEVMKKLTRLNSMNKIHSGTFQSVMNILQNMKSQNFIAKNNFFDANKLWDNEKIWCVGFLGTQEEEYMSVFVDKILKQVKARSITPEGKEERYVILVDDCGPAFGVHLRGAPSVYTGIACLQQWRSKGINLISSIQDPKTIHRSIYGGTKHFFIYKTPMAEDLLPYIPNRNIINEIKSLDYRPELRISQCIHILPDRQRYVKFYPFNSPIAN